MNAPREPSVTGRVSLTGCLIVCLKKSSAEVGCTTARVRRGRRRQKTCKANFSSKRRLSTSDEVEANVAQQWLACARDRKPRSLRDSAGPWIPISQA